MPDVDLRLNIKTERIRTFNQGSYGYLILLLGVSSLILVAM